MYFQSIKGKSIARGQRNDRLQLTNDACQSQHDSKSELFQQHSLARIINLVHVCSGLGDGRQSYAHNVTHL